MMSTFAASGSWVLTGRNVKSPVAMERVWRGANGLEAM